MRTEAGNVRPDVRDLLHRLVSPRHFDTPGSRYRCNVGSAAAPQLDAGDAPLAQSHMVQGHFAR
ncbi:MAG: hypothetical protein QOD93_6965 [Acetobacteraceae bacterium]|jgi:hypothetical protein|nr:hypothetical protein [Acetobacteraceae bacterium]